MTTKAFDAMGSRITVVLDEGERATESALEMVPQWFEKWESVLSRFRAGSELNRLQGRSGKDFGVSPTLCAVLAESVRAAEYTDGMVTPFVQDALRAAGYEESFDEKDFSPAPDLRTAIRIPDWRAIRCDPSRGRVDLPRGSRLDLGGIAKGWAAGQAAAELSRHGPVLVDAGGDISVSGPRADGSPWPIGVGNPFSPAELLFTIALAAGGVATSGRDYRKWIQSGRQRHHIIDPRTGEPAETDVLTATIVAPDACRAEAGAKAAFLLGSRDGIAWLDRHPELAGMLVLGDRRIEYSREFSKYVWN
jgi:thiamine biosynthesis lipoprotein